MSTPFGMYGINPHYTLAETPYARMTGQFTPMSDSMLPGTSSYLQPMFVDMNPYMNNTGVPAYPSLISSQAMMNPEIPLVQPNQIYDYQNTYQNYPQGYGPPAQANYGYGQQPSYSSYGYTQPAPNYSGMSGMTGGYAQPNNPFGQPAQYATVPQYGQPSFGFPQAPVQPGMPGLYMQTTTYMA